MLLRALRPKWEEPPPLLLCALVSLLTRPCSDPQEIQPPPFRDEVLQLLKGAKVFTPLSPAICTSCRHSLRF